MAVFTTAAIAISAAIATTTVATVTAAVALVSVAIGVTGLAVTAVGLATGSKDLLKAGKIMGYVGLAGTVASLGANVAIDGFSEAMQNIAQGVGDAYSSAGDSISNFFTGGAQSGLLPTPPDVTAGLIPTDYGASVSGDMGGAGVMAPPPNTLGVDTIAGSGIPPTGPQGVEAGQARVIPASYHGSLGQAPTGMDMQGDLTYVANPPSNVVPADMRSSDVLSYKGVPSYQSQFIAEGGFNKFSQPLPAGDNLFQQGFGNQGIPPLVAGLDPTFTRDAAVGIPDWMKYAGATGAMQAGGGLLSGYLAGATAEERLNFEKLKNEQDQAQRTGITNVRSAYAPQVQFQSGGPVIVPRPPAGLINT